MLEDTVLTGTAIEKACDAAMPRRKPTSYNYRCAFWWNEDIANMQKECIRARRLHQRFYAANEELIVKFLEARSKLKSAIKLSNKKLCFQQLCSDVDRDPWGRPYKTVMVKIKYRHTSSPFMPRNDATNCYGALPTTSRRTLCVTIDKKL